MRLFKLNDTVLSLKGNADGFLNGLTSNTLEASLNAFLNQHGRIIATFRQKRTSDEEFLIAVPVVAVENLLKHLERYARLSHVKLEPSALGTYMDADTGTVLWEAAAHAGSVFDEEFTRFRLDRQVPLMGVDYQADEFILNVHEYNYVSYTKGCFLGQEPVAKVHNRSKPTRKLTVKFEDECSPEEAARMTSQLRDPAGGRRQGFVFVSNLGKTS
ncbi:MAG: hypothetical protein KGK03_03605 [Candidatus Omnitrophica bacterium]|nr:hypothetical protein [Candidatus Omnitrophota bacterium]MDE2222140.1 hypothetical protein [Candidatus Omnitrophota bacterium]